MGEGVLFGVNRCFNILQVAPTLVPLLKFYFHEEVRKAAVSGSWLVLYFTVLTSVNL